MAAPRRYEEMTEEERIEASDKAAIFEWFEEQTKGVPQHRKKKKIDNLRKALDELLKHSRIVEDKVK